MLDRNAPLALFMEESLGEIQGKMGYGVLRYSPNRVVCILDSTKAGMDHRPLSHVDKPCPVVATIDEAVALGAKVLVLGIAPPGGLIPPAWLSSLDRAVETGMSLVNGLHDLLGLRYKDLKPGQFIWDVRVEPAGLGIGSAAAATLKNRRLLMIGTDMAVGKMTAGLEIHTEALRRGIQSEFVATGQIGITVTGRGVPLDAIRLDFASGAIEREVMTARSADLIVVEGQGALIHPASSATLPLIRGSCPTHFVLCCRAGQEHLRRIESIKIPDFRTYIDLYESLSEACGTFARAKCVGIAVNTAHLSDEEARGAVDGLEQRYGLPCADPVRHGAGRLLDAVVA